LPGRGSWGRPLALWYDCNLIFQQQAEFFVNVEKAPYREIHHGLKAFSFSSEIWR